MAKNKFQFEKRQKDLAKKKKKEEKRQKREDRRTGEFGDSSEASAEELIVQNSEQSLSPPDHLKSSEENPQSDPDQESVAATESSNRAEQ